MCFASSFYFFGHLIEQFGQIAIRSFENNNESTTATNKSSECPPISSKQQLISNGLINFWLFLLTPAIGFAMIRSKNSVAVKSTSFSAFFGIGISHLLSSQFELAINNHQPESTKQSNCSNQSNYIAKIVSIATSTDLSQVIADFEPFGNHLTKVFAVFSIFLLIRWYCLKKATCYARRKLPVPRRHPHVDDFAASHYSWSRLAAITIGSLIITVAIVWNLAVIIATISAKMARKRNIFVMVIGSSEPKAVVEKAQLSSFLSTASDAITIGIIAISVMSTIFCATIVYFMTSDSGNTDHPNNGCNNNSVVAVVANDGETTGRKLANAFLFVTCASVLLLHFGNLLSWATSLETKQPQTINIWLCYSQLVHAFVQTISICVLNSSVTSVLSCKSSTNNNQPSNDHNFQQRDHLRSLNLLNSFANTALFSSELLRHFGGTFPSPPAFPLPAIEALNSAHYLIAAFILFRLAKRS